MTEIQHSSRQEMFCQGYFLLMLSISMFNKIKTIAMQDRGSKMFYFLKATISQHSQTLLYRTWIPQSRMPQTHFISPA